MTDKDIQENVEHILKIVAESKNVKNYDVFANINKNQGDGFLSEFFTGEVFDKDNGEKIQVAIKRAPVDGLSFVFGIETFYKNEINFYSKIIPDLDKFQREKRVKYPFDNIPRYFAGNVDSRNIFVAMENLKTKGYVLFDKRNYLDSKHLEFIFKTYGKFHALSFTFKQNNLEEYEHLLRNIDNMFEKLTEMSHFIQQMSDSYLCALDTFDPITEAETLAKLNKVHDVKQAIQNVQTYKGNHACLIHGDCWSNNMLFKYKESGELEDIKLVDFQVPSSGTPVYDLSYFFYSGASKQDMDKLDSYLDVYYKSFCDFARELGGNPKDMFPMDILKKEWKEYAILGILLGCQLWVAKLMDKEEIVNILNQKGLAPEKYWDLFYEKMVEIRRGADFRERARNLCLHAVEYGIL